jgi:hypothetical protein
MPAPARSAWNTAIDAFPARAKAHPMAWRAEIKAVSETGDRLAAAAGDLEAALARPIPAGVNAEELRAAIAAAFAPSLAAPDSPTPERLEAASHSAKSLAACAASASEILAATSEPEAARHAPALDSCASLPTTLAAARLRIEHWSELRAKSDCASIEWLLNQAANADRPPALRSAAVSALLACEQFPSTPEELNRVIAAVSSTPIPEPLAAALRAAWQRGAARAAAASSVAELSSYLSLVSEHPSLGPLPPWAAFDQIAIAERTTDPTSDSDASRHAAALAQRIRDIPAIADNAAVGEWLRELDSAAKSRGRPIEQLGPGALPGWTAKSAPDNSTVVFTSPAPRSLAMTFRRVQTARGPAYLLTDEVALNTFAAGYETPSVRTEVGRAGGPTEQRRVGAGAGLRTWTFGPGASIRACATWMPDARRESVTELVSVKPPTDRFPMQAIPASGAQAWAKALNCRLPSLEEWQAAVDDAAPTQQRPNLRDISFARIWNKLAPIGREVIAGEVVQPIPASGDLPTDDPDDQSALFEPTDSTSTQFRHLFGNVAEFVIADLAADPIARDNIRIVGGSAFTRPGEERAPIGLPAATDARSWFSDAGFRLAFDAASGIEPNGELRRRVREQLSRIPLLSK